MKFDGYTLALLARPATTPDLDTAAQAALQDAHLAHLARLHEQGHLLAAGPFLGGPSPELRGMALFRGSPQEAQRLGDEDPAVKAGTLVYRCFPWTVPSGAMTFQRTHFPRSMREVGP